MNKLMILCGLALVQGVTIAAQEQPRTKETRSTKDTIKTSAPAPRPAVPEMPPKETRSTRDTTRTALPPRDPVKKDSAKSDTPIIKRTTVPPPQKRGS